MSPIRVLSVTNPTAFGLRLNANRLLCCPQLLTPPRTSGTNRQNMAVTLTPEKLTRVIKQSSKNMFDNAKQADLKKYARTARECLRRHVAKYSRPNFECFRLTFIIILKSDPSKLPSLSNIYSVQIQYPHPNKAIEIISRRYLKTCSSR